MNKVSRFGIAAVMAFITLLGSSWVYHYGVALEKEEVWFAKAVQFNSFTLGVVAFIAFLACTIMTIGMAVEGEDDEE